jgi:hypothetical protein
MFIVTSEFLNKLNSRYGNNGGLPSIPTPVQTERHIERNETLLKISQETGIPDLGLLAKVFINKNGRFMGNKLPKFMESMEKIMQQTNGVELLSYMDEGCVKQSGQIKISRLRKRRRST